MSGCGEGRKPRKRRGLQRVNHANSRHAIAHRDANIPQIQLKVEGRTQRVRINVSGCENDGSRKAIEDENEEDARGPRRGEVGEEAAVFAETFGIVT